MTERIDHRSEANRQIEMMQEGESPFPFDWNSASKNERWAVMATLAEAQVHATLALVEQRRIANRIALAREEWKIRGGGTITWDIMTSGISEDGQIQMVRLDPDIEAALGPIA